MTLDTECLAYQYASSTQSPSILGCRQVSFRVWHACGDLTDSEPGLRAAVGPHSRFEFSFDLDLPVRRNN